MSTELYTKNGGTAVPVEAVPESQPTTPPATETAPAPAIDDAVLVPAPPVPLADELNAWPSPLATSEAERAETKKVLTDVGTLVKPDSAAGLRLSWLFRNAIEDSTTFDRASHAAATDREIERQDREPALDAIRDAIDHNASVARALSDERDAGLEDLAGAVASDRIPLDVDGDVTMERLEQAVGRKVGEMAEAGVAEPLDGGAGAFGRLATHFLTGLMPLACGALLALTLGTTVGLIAYQDLRAPQYVMGKLVAALVIGTATESSLGMLWERLTSLIATLLSAQENDPSRPVVRGSRLLIAGLALLGVILFGALSLIHGIGLAHFHEQMIAHQRLLGVAGAADHPLKLGVYWLMGAAITGIYLASLSVRALSRTLTSLTQTTSEAGWAERYATAWNSLSPEMLKAVTDLQLLNVRIKQLEDENKALMEEREKLKEIKLTPVSLARLKQSEERAIISRTVAEDALLTTLLTKEHAK